MAAWQYGLIGICIGGAVSAAPMPPPPPGYQGDQYIDAAGCVFRRAGGQWTAHLDDAGAGICGFPPSLGSGPAPATPDPEAILTERLAEGLRPGEFTADPTPLETRDPAPEPLRPDPLQEAIKTSIAIQPVLDRRTGLSAQDDVCAGLGYDGAPDASSGIGLCPGMKLGDAKPVPSAPTPAKAVPATAAPTVRPAAPKVRSAEIERPKAAADAPREAAQPKGDMIPAGARYVQVGIFADDASADASLRRIAGRGHPTAQIRPSGDKGPRIILAGPFGERAALVAALADLRIGGFAGAVAR